MTKLDVIPDSKVPFVEAITLIKNIVYAQKNRCRIDRFFLWCLIKLIHFAFLQYAKSYIEKQSEKHANSLILYSKLALGS